MAVPYENEFLSVRPSPLFLDVDDLLGLLPPPLEEAADRPLGGRVRAENAHHALQRH